MKTLPEVLDDLREIKRAVFGDIGDEPNVYADYDTLIELEGKMRSAILVLERLHELALRLSSLEKLT